MDAMGQSASSTSFEVLTLGLQDEIFALEAGTVREILDLVPVTDVPGARDFMGGLINVRGKVVPLADLRLRFGMAQTPPTTDTRVVVVEVDIDGDPVTVGILADKVHEVTTVDTTTIQETPRLGMRWNPDFIRCIAKRGSEFIIVPEMKRILA